MKYHRKYKNASEVLSSYKIHIDEAVEHYGVSEIIRSLAQYNKTDADGLINTLAFILNSMDEWKFQKVLMRMNSRNVEILKEFF